MFHPSILPNGLPPSIQMTLHVGIDLGFDHNMMRHGETATPDTRSNEKGT
jgi:hypothetical protein